MTDLPKGQIFFPTKTGRRRWDTTLKCITLSAFTVTTIILSTTGNAAADPEGFYHVTGTEVDGTPFEGTVSVVRTGETYKVRWTVDGVTYHGSGLGAAATREHAVIGPATHEDEVLIVGFASLFHGFGISIYVEQNDGNWDGVWTEYGADHIATETWTPIKPALSEEALLQRETSQRMENDFKAGHPKLSKRNNTNPNIASNSESIELY